MGNIVILNFINQYRSRLWHLEAEEYLGWLVRHLPGMAGVTVRALVYRFLFKKLSSFILIYPGVYLTHTYGIICGKRCSINSGAILDGRGGITLGDDVMIGPHVYIASSSHAYNDLSIPMSSRGHDMKPVIIESDVWIGANATILGGVTIKKGAIVGAGAVVRQDVLSYEVVGGVPAKRVGFRRDGKNQSFKK